MRIFGIENIDTQKHTYDRIHVFSKAGSRGGAEAPIYIGMELLRCEGAETKGRNAEGRDGPNWRNGWAAEAKLLLGTGMFGH